MENFDSDFKSNDPMVISDEIKTYLLEISKWAKFLAILGFIGLGIMVLMGLFVLGIGTKVPGFSGMMEGSALYTFILAILVILYFFPLRYLYKAAGDLKRSALSPDQDLLTSGFKNLKSHYKFIGIMAIVLVSIYLLIFLGGMIGLSMVGG